MQNRIRELKKEKVEVKEEKVKRRKLHLHLQYDRTLFLDKLADTNEVSYIIGLLPDRAQRNSSVREGGGGETDRQRHRQRDTDRQTGRQRHRQGDTDRQTQTDRHRHRQAETETDLWINKSKTFQSIGEDGYHLLN